MVCIIWKQSIILCILKLKINLYRLQQRELPFLAKIEYSNKKKIFTAYEKESWHFLQKLDTEIKKQKQALPPTRKGIATSESVWKKCLCCPNSVHKKVLQMQNGAELVTLHYFSKWLCNIACVMWNMWNWSLVGAVFNICGMLVIWVRWCHVCGLC